ncbi:lipoprotein insertase outer membrane protein LolB [Pseudidiomarina sp.]|uniref:lipoprotein insertase outer membrane protein LolB n=1 Tax=Pseudidiomarina sp. TaxID=2081707 RepID=UPI00299DD89D|nr:lipoprotein insertase outer membrane protein LolB [Pseudidiomarina sp.]MDX1705104.1 lipoprotein insertase outer membrane protein LolB [Pseudidiomarina sp.]
MKLLVLLLALAGLTACTTIPVTSPATAVDSAAVIRHQTNLAAIDNWTLRGQLAIFDLTADERHAVYIDWQQTPTSLSMRLSHPLKGTLARLEESPLGAILTDEDGMTYQASTAEQLLSQYFGLDLPLDLMRELVLGRQLPGMSGREFILQGTESGQLALLSSYQLSAAGQQWQASLSHYASVDGVLLPHSFHLSAPAWRIKLRITQWLI